MIEAEEQDTCRICSAPAEEEQPLFYPCKCSGTIRYIHQDCLTTWLAHSKKKTCDVCKHPYSFTKVYANDMPSRLPPILLLRRVAQQAFFAMLFAIRAVAVSIIWLALLPWMTVMTWRIYFTLGDSAAWWISDRPRPADVAGPPNPLYSVFHPDPAAPASTSLVTRIATSPLWASLSTDIFAGQIIASLVVLTFVAVFLLREWISQNARPGIFDDEEGAPAPPAPVIVPAVAPIQLPRQERRLHRLPEPFLDANERIAFAERHREILRRQDSGVELNSRVRGKSVGKDELQDHNRSTSSHSSRRSVSEPPLLRDSPAVDSVSGGHSSSGTDALLDPDTKLPPTLPAVLSSYQQRRPPLPVTTPTGEDPLVLLTPTQPPLYSPQLATYRAPEELEAGPSRAYFDEAGSDYKGKQKASAEEMEAEHDLYFKTEEDAEMPALQSTSDSEDDEPVFDHSPVAENPEEEEEEEEEDYADIPVWEAIEIEDDEVAEVGDGEMMNEDMRVAFEEDDGHDDLPEGDIELEPMNAPAGPQDVVFEGDMNDDLDGNVDDDMEGAMEAIGMRGPILGVVQNAALMIFVLDTAIGLLVWLPFTLGKSAALLSLNPQRFFQIIHFPIRAMRIMTDPVVDVIMYMVASLLVPIVVRAGLRAVRLAFGSAMMVTGLVIGKAKVAQTMQGFDSLVDRVKTLSFSSKSIPDAEEKTAESSILTYVMNERTEPYFAALGKEVREGAEQVADTWTQLALGHGPKEKVFAVMLGYFVVVLMVALYLNLLTVGNMKSAGRAVRTAVREQLLVLKVAAFIFIELAIFPFGCGVVLDLCTVWLFPEANFVSRLEFFKRAALTAMFYHWVAGTMFMYSFAVLLSACRTLMRRGAMWFVKDPQDQNTHPIRDILDRPTLTQLRKIFISGVMYSVVVAGLVTSVAGLIWVGDRSVLPLRWKNREPLSSVPVDLLFLHVVLPYTMRYFRPRSPLRRVSKALWKFVAQKLRLSSYFFGGRYPLEEFTPASWSGVLFPVTDSKDVFDGTFRRVPATDNLALPRDMRATVLVNEDGVPIDFEAAELMRRQDQEAVKAKRLPKEDYTVVYMPPYFRWRVMAFIGTLWATGSLALGLVIAVPMQFGRGFFALIVDREVHDGYSWLAGVYLLWACYLFGRAVDRLDKRRQRRGGDDPRADLRLLVIKRGFLWVTKIAYMILALGVIIPTLISLVIAFYLILPMRLFVDPSLTPRIRFVDEWALGLLYTKIIMFVQRTQPPNPISRGIQHIKNNGWTHPEPLTATKEVIGPLILGLAGMIVLPGGAFLLAQRYLPFVPQNSTRILFMEVYPIIFATVAGLRFGSVLFEILGVWSQSIRDKEFLVEMRLKNHEPEVSSSRLETRNPVVVQKRPEETDEPEGEDQAEEEEEDMLH